MSAPPAPSSVLPEYGPPLPELLRGRFGVSPRLAALGALVAALVVAAVAVYVLVLRNPTRNVVEHGPPTFNFSYQPGVLKPAAPGAGELYRLEQRRDGRLLQSFAVRAFKLPRYTGAVSGALPVYAAQEIQRLRARFPGLTGPFDEGKQIVNKVVGYAVGFEARVDGRPLFGREVLLVEPLAHARSGVAITMLESPELGIGSSLDIGNGGALKIALHTVSFGTTRRSDY
jgi:hypothetical protein